MNKNKSMSNRGFVVIVALIALMAMSFFLLTGAATTTSAVKVSGNYSKTVDVFNIAEAGLARARPLLEGQDFSTLLSTYYGSYLISPTSFNDGTYEVTVTNDDHDGASNTTDSNGIIRVTSIGRNSQGGKVKIDTYVQLIGGTSPISFPPPPTDCSPSPGNCDSAVLACGAFNGQKQGASAIFDGDDYPPPPFGCTGSGCNTSPTTSGNWDIIGDSSVSMTSTGGGSVAVKSSTGTASQCSAWQTFYDQWASVSASAPGVVLINSDSYSGSNDCSNPKVYLINTASSTITFAGNNYLCGMFIVASNTSIITTGTITFVGMFLMMGNYSGVQVNPIGTANLHGKIVFRGVGVDTQKEVYIGGNSRLTFSSQGVAYALQAVNNANAGGGSGGSGTLLTAAWEETY